MVDSRPDAFHEAHHEKNDWELLMKGYEWKMNIPTDPDDPSFEEGLDIISALREMYGPENVITNRAVMDSDTGKLTRVIGRLGVHVRTGIEPTDAV